MLDQQIYKLWLSNFPGRRHLRRERWEELKKVLAKERIRTVLEFGSGVSTCLFANARLKVLSLETDKEYMKKVRTFCNSKGVTFQLWDNKTVELTKTYDLALVDGVLPRTNQISLAKSNARIIAIDDANGSFKRLITQLMQGYERIDSESTIMAIFKSVQNLE